MFSSGATRRQIEAARRTLGLLIFAAVAMAAAPALGAGYGLKEHSADAMAAAYAGAAATQIDASYLAYNPASLASVIDQDFSFSAIEILPGSKANYTAAATSAGNPAGGSLNPSGFISDATVPALGFRQRISDSWAVGLSISAPWGLRTDYPRTWSGRYYAQKSSLLTINATPIVSYQVMPGLAVAAGLQVEYAQGTLTSVIDTGTLGALLTLPGAIPGGQDSFAKLSGNSLTVGYTLGVIDRIGAVSVGISYRSSLQHNLKGPLTFTLDGSGVGATIRSLTGLFTDTRQVTPLIMPDEIESGARFDLSDQWSGLLEVDWTHWNRFREIRVTAANPLQPDDMTTTRWQNTIFASLGAEYRASPLWTVRAGIGYDQSPTRDATREPRIPDADRIWLSAGFRFRMSDSADVNVTASRLFNLQQNIALNPAISGAALRGTLVGTTESYVNVAGLQLTYRPN
jgi:long-chain fatty acid transport protein